MDNGICIENIPRQVDVSKLCSIFRKHGRIISANIAVDEHLNSTGKGYISFDNPSSALVAAKSMDGFQVNGNVIKVWAGENNSINKTSRNLYTKVFVKNINPLWDEFDLTSEFCKFGDISDVSISMTDGKSNGYGFVVFKDHSAAKAAVENKHKCLIVQPFIPKELRSAKPVSVDTAREILEKSIQFNNLHVKNIPKDMEEDELKELFDVFGQISSVRIAKDSAQKSKGFGFVCFKSKYDAKNALENMHGCSLGAKTLEVNFNQKKEARQHYLLLKNFNTNDEESSEEVKSNTRDWSQTEKKKANPNKKKSDMEGKNLNSEKKSENKNNLLFSFSSKNKPFTEP